VNVRQLYAFARRFGKPVVKWRLPLTKQQQRCMPSHCDIEKLYASEPGMFGYYVDGSPVLLSHTIKATRKLVNGSPGLMHSLSFEGAAPVEYVTGMLSWQAAASRITSGLHEVFEIVLLAPPDAVNVRVGQSNEDASYVPAGMDRALAKRRGLVGRHCFHGVPLEDLSSLITSCVPGAQVVPIRQASDVESVACQSVYAAMCFLPKKLEVKVMEYLPAFAMTDFKLQGRTLPKLVMNICERPVPPYLDWSSFYVQISRVCERGGLRLLYVDKKAIHQLSKLQIDPCLVAWERGYKINPNGLGTWDRQLAAEALNDVFRVRAEAKKTSAESRKKVHVQKAKATGPSKRRDLPRVESGDSKRRHESVGAEVDLGGQCVSGPEKRKELARAEESCAKRRPDP
jgi:hypothetical protein